MKEIRNLNNKVLATGDNIKDVLKEETSARKAGPRKSFKNADLRDLDLSFLKLFASNDASSQRRSDFMGSDFSGSNLYGAEFSGIDFRGCNFTDCDMRRVSMVMCDLTGACLNNVDMSSVTENKTGYSTWITSTVFDNVHSEGGDFQGAMLHTESANGSVFVEGNFEDVNFNKDWNGATFHCCNLEDSSPGTYPPSVGAKFGVNISKCNVKDMLLDRCPSLPTEMKDCKVCDSVWVPGWEGEDDRWDVARKKTEAVERSSMDALIAKYQAQYDAEQAKYEKDRLAKKAAADKAYREKIAKWDAQIKKQQEDAEKSAKALVQQVQVDSVQHDKVSATKVKSLPPLTATFEPKPVSFTNGKHFIRIMFNRALRVGWRTVRDQGFNTVGGTITRVSRVSGRSDYWQLEVKPTTTGDITITTTDALRGKSGQAPTSVTVVIK